MINWTPNSLARTAHTHRSGSIFPVNSLRYRHMNGMVLSSSKRRMMLALVARSIPCKLDRSCSGVHGLPVASKCFGSASWAVDVVGFTFADFDENKPIFEANAPSAASSVGASTFARFDAVFVVFALALFRSVAIFVCAKSITFSSSEEITWTFRDFGNLALVFAGVAFFVAVFALDVLVLQSQRIRNCILCETIIIDTMRSLTFFFSAAMARSCRCRSLSLLHCPRRRCQTILLFSPHGVSFAVPT